MADYSGYIEPDEDAKVAGYSHNQTVYTHLTVEDIKRAIGEVVDSRLLKQGTDESDTAEKSDGDERNDYAKGYDAGWSEGYQAAKYKATVQAVKAIGEL